MTIKHGQPIWAAAKRAKAMANSVEANERRRERERPVIDWNERIANLLDILDHIYGESRARAAAHRADSTAAAKAMSKSRLTRF